MLPKDQSGKGRCSYFCRVSSEMGEQLNSKAFVASAKKYFNARSKVAALKPKLELSWQTPQKHTTSPIMISIDLALSRPCTDEMIQGCFKELSLHLKCRATKNAFGDDDLLMHLRSSLIEYTAMQYSQSEHSELASRVSSKLASMYPVCKDPESEATSDLAVAPDLQENIDQINIYSVPNSLSSTPHLPSSSH